MPKLRPLSILLLALAASAWPQAREAAVQRALDAYVEQHKVVGVSAAVLERDGTLFAAGAGFQDREERVSATGRTVYRLGSISKPVTAVAAMQLVEQGRLSLFSDVRLAVAEWPANKPTITLRHLLTHTSGIRHYIATRRDVYYEPFTVARSLELFKDDEFLFKPGEKVSYSTHAFSLVARMVEKAGGEPFAEYVRNRVALPAGAPTLALEDRARALPERSALYEKTSGTLVLRAAREENISWKSGGGGMEASAPDLARFAMAVLENRLTRSHTTDFMFQPQTVDGLATKRGLGWALDNGGNPQHGGAQQGCLCFLTIQRESGRVIVVMSNTSGSHPIQELARAVADGWTSGEREPGAPAGGTSRHDRS